METSLDDYVKVDYVVEKNVVEKNVVEKNVVEKNVVEKNVVEKNVDYIDLGYLGDVEYHQQHLNRRIKYLSNLLYYISEKYIQNPYSENIIRRISRISIEINNLNDELNRQFLKR
jgi:hypothetical protein